ncbi:hypothetical protein B0H17DRAFT_1186826 [Mycena rosella]|uniref:Uncharacterized protein n=1 Tax=Mycena rosella TaxID=1033263 RepID=A0AAD7CDM2_MYCRO|nr:hypothetical protein B0H17DRAFT_1186826 [Mycena rosella]
MSGARAGRVGVSFVAGEAVDEGEELMDDGEEAARARRTNPLIHPTNRIACSGSTNASSAEKTHHAGGGYRGRGRDGEERVRDDEHEMQDDARREEGRSEERGGSGAAGRGWIEREGYGGERKEGKKSGEREEGSDARARLPPTPRATLDAPARERGTMVGGAPRKGREGWGVEGSGRKEYGRRQEGVGGAAQGLASASTVVVRRRIRLTGVAGAESGTEAPTLQQARDARTRYLRAGSARAASRSTPPRLGANRDRGPGREGRGREMMREGGWGWCSKRGAKGKGMRRGSRRGAALWTRQWRTAEGEGGRRRDTDADAWGAEAAPSHFVVEAPSTTARWCSSTLQRRSWSPTTIGRQPRARDESKEEYTGRREGRGRE